MKLFSPTGQNVFIENGVLSPRFGSEVFGTDLNQYIPGQSQWVFNEKGPVSKQVMMRVWGTKLEYFHPTLLVWVELYSGYTSGLLFGRAEQNNAPATVNGITTGYIYFCNSVENMGRWNGAIATITSNTATVITINEADVASLGFTTTGFLYINGVQYFYTGISGNTFTGLTALPTFTTNDAVAQSIEFNATIPKGNVLMVDNMALYVAGVLTNANTVYRSKIDDATNWTVGTPRLSGQAFFGDVSEYGGRIIGFVKDEKVIYVIKDTIIKTLEYLATSDALTNDTPIFKNLKAYDGKSQNTGGITGGSVFSNGNGIFFINNRNEINQLDRLEYIDYPQIVPVSDLIKVTAAIGLFDEAVGIIYQQRAFISYKQTINSKQNDAVLVYDIIEKKWEEPIVGWYVNDWCIYNNELHWISSITNTSYHSLATKTDNGSAFTAIWRSWQEDFDFPALTKNLGGVYVEGYISDQVLYNKDINEGGLLVSILFDENGSTSAVEYHISADNANIIFSPVQYNPFGANAFGVERFGSNVDISGLKKFRCFIPIKDNIEFFTAQIQFSSNGEAYDWQVVRWGWLITEFKPENMKLQLNK